MCFYRYCIDPIDFWPHLTPLTEFMTSTIQAAQCSGEFVDNLFRLCNLIKSMEGMEFWDLDITEGIYVCSIPMGAECCGDSWSYMLIWKQSNNGSTFIVSEVELKHMKYSGLFFNQHEVSPLSHHTG